MAVQKLSLYLSYKLDDSYTPAALSVRAGTSPGDLQEVRAVTLDRPTECGSKPIHAYILQVIILANHMNGKDTHVRGMRVLGPIEDQASWDDPFPFVDPKFKMYEHIR
ncbi:anaphase-promoting complex, subunit 10/DOC domain-containing protein [Lactarius quietus]|nr:anaphase-promoting complex, subunit 10/DOC domain-containing protein [Lactarius quietus]